LTALASRAGASAGSVGGATLASGRGTLDAAEHSHRAHPSKSIAQAWTTARRAAALRVATRRSSRSCEPKRAPHCVDVRASNRHRRSAEDCSAVNASADR